MSVSNYVFAHDGAEHTSDLEIWVSGIGIVLIIGTATYVLSSKEKSTYNHFAEEETKADK